MFIKTPFRRAVLPTHPTNVRLILLDCALNYQTNHFVVCNKDSLTIKIEKSVLIKYRYYVWDTNSFAVYFIKNILLIYCKFRFIFVIQDHISNSYFDSFTRSIFVIEIYNIFSWMVVFWYIHIDDSTKPINLSEITK